MRNVSGRFRLQRRLTALITGFLAAAAPFSAAADVVKYRSDFETPASLAGWRPAGAASVDRSVAHSGRTSLRISRTSDQEEAAWTSPDFPVSGGKTYRFSAWMKASGVFMPDPSFAPEADIVWLNALYGVAGEVPGSSRLAPLSEQSGPAKTASFDWSRIERVIRAPDSAVAAHLVFRFSKTTGTAWLDDPEAEFCPDAAEAGAQAPSFLQIWPRRAGARGDIRSAGGALFDPGEPVSFFVRRPPAAGSDDQIRWSITDALERVIAQSQTVVQPGDLQTISLPNLDSQTGRWLLCRWEWVSSGKAVASRTISLGVMPAIGPAGPGVFGSTGNPDQLALVKRLGATIMREDIFWRDDVQSGPDAPVIWRGLFDQRLTRPESDGFQVLANLSWCSPAWAYLHAAGAHDQSAGFGSRPDALSRAVDATVRRYSRSVSYWQLGNEVNLHDPASRADYYIDFKAFSRAVRAAEPSAKVVLGSQNRGVDDIRRVIDDGLLPYLDVIDTHYWSEDDILALRRLLDAASPDRHIAIWQTEVGLFSRDPDDVVANSLVKQFTYNAAAGEENVIWCYLGGTPSLGEREEEAPDRAGSILLTSYSEMPSQLYFSQSLITRSIQGAAFVKRFLWAQTGSGYLFRKGTRNVLVCWLDGLDPIAGALTLGASTVDISDWTGRQSTIEPRGKPIPVVLSSRPWIYSWSGPDAAGAVSFHPSPIISVLSARPRELALGSNILRVTAARSAEKGTAWRMEFDAGRDMSVSPRSLTLKAGETRTVDVRVAGISSAGRATLDVRAADNRGRTAWFASEFRIDRRANPPADAPAAASVSASSDLQIGEPGSPWRHANGKPLLLEDDPLKQRAGNVACSGSGLDIWQRPINLPEPARGCLFTVDVYVAGGNLQAGIADSRPGPNRYQCYMLGVDKSGNVSLSARMGLTGPWESLSSTPARLSPGWNKLKLDWRRDGTLDLFANGDLIIEKIDRRIPLSADVVQLQTNGDGDKYVAAVILTEY